ncbi:MAG: 3-dehydroquinate synthase [Verrucomicrobiota bacterium]
MVTENCSMVKVLLGDRSYDIRIGADLTPGAGYCARVDGLRALIISDSNVDAIYGDVFEKRIGALGFNVFREKVPAGEASKNLSCAAALYSKAIEAGLDRSSFIFALGGGVIGDLAGFVAATYLRGIRYVQAPTTTLAMLDSSVGGKTGLNMEEGKNLVGAFYQPVEVAIDLSTLVSLPEKEYLSGLAELVKHAVIWDAELFRSLESGIERLAGRDPVFLQEVITRSCEIKAAVVAMDERESGVRAALNFGHTLGHALEKAAGYGKYLHGEAVAVGMAYAADLAAASRGFSKKDAARIKRLLSGLKLPVSPSEEGRKPGWEQIRHAMTRDKKALGSVPRFTLVESLGQVCVGCVVEEGLMSDVYADM